MSRVLVMNVLQFTLKSNVNCKETEEIGEMFKWLCPLWIKLERLREVIGVLDFGTLHLHTTRNISISLPPICTCII